MPSRLPLLYQNHDYIPKFGMPSRLPLLYQNLNYIPKFGMPSRLPLLYQAEEDPDENESEAGDVAKPVPDPIKFLQKTVEHTRHFVSMVACPQWQLTALEIVANAVLIIKMDQ